MQPARTWSAGQGTARAGIGLRGSWELHGDADTSTLLEVPDSEPGGINSTKQGAEVVQ